MMADSMTMKSRVRQFFLGSSSAAGRAPIARHWMEHGQQQREYWLAIPQHTAQSKRALVIVLHGGAGANAQQVMGLGFPPSPLSVWLEIAEREQLMIMAPNGTKMGWNDSFADIANKPTSDDVGFISALIDLAIDQYAADPERVFVIGVSKGGMMAYRLAIEIPHKLAAFSALLASMPVKSVCEEPQHAISALIVANTKDPFIPYKGGKFFYTPALSPMKSVAETVAIWRELAQFPDAPKVSQLTIASKHSKTCASRYDWCGDDPNVQIGLVEVAGAGHTEASVSQRYPGWITMLVGAQNADFEVAELAWDFFKTKTRSSQSRA